MAASSIQSNKRPWLDQNNSDEEEDEILSRSELKALYKIVRAWLDSEHSRTWRAITEEEGLTDATYRDSLNRDVKLTGGVIVPAVCKHCNERVEKRAIDLFKAGCGSRACLIRRPRHTNMRKRQAVIASNTGNCMVRKGDVVEEQVVEAVRLLRGEVLGAAKIGELNGSWDVVVVLPRTTVGVQVKLASLDGAHPKYTLGGFKSSYPDDMVIVAKVAKTGLWLVATCAVLRALRTGEGKCRTFHFNAERPEVHLHLVDNLDTAVRAMVRMAARSTPLTRQLLLRDLSRDQRLELFSFEQVQRLLRQHGETLYHSSTNADATDAMVRNLRIQLAAGSCTSGKHDDVFQVGLFRHAGRDGKELHNRPYRDTEFDVFVFVAVKNVDGDNEFELLHMWFIPMPILVETGVVATLSAPDSGRMTIAVAVPGHRSSAGPTKKWPFPFFENCCDNPAPLLELLRSGAFGGQPSEERLRDQVVLDALLAQ